MGGYHSSFPWLRRVESATATNLKHPKLQGVRPMTSISRRQLIKVSALASVIPALPLTSLISAPATATDESDPWLGLKVGVATYTLRELPIEEAIKGVKRVGLK